MNTTPLEDLLNWAKDCQSCYCVSKIEGLMQKERDLMIDAYYAGVIDAKTGCSSFPAYIHETYPTHPTNDIQWRIKHAPKNPSKS